MRMFTHFYSTKRSRATSFEDASFLMVSFVGWSKAYIRTRHQRSAIDTSVLTLRKPLNLASLRLVFVLTVLGISFSASNLLLNPGVFDAAAENSVPFQGMFLAYDVKLTGLYQGIQGSFVGISRYEFSSIHDGLAVVAGSLSGNIRAGAYQKPLQESVAVDNFPTDRSTIFYLDEHVQPGSDIMVFVAPSLTIPQQGIKTPVVVVPASYQGSETVSTVFGQREAYRYSYSDQNSVASAFYDSVAKILLRLEISVKKYGVFSEVAGSASLQDTNASLGNKPSFPSSSTSQCLIATSAYGSPFSPHVQFLREYRDHTILRTYAGSAFMRGFNLWYYSFSPEIAVLLRENSFGRMMVRFALSPLLLILVEAENVSSYLSFSPELAILTAGLFVSGLIGLVYGSPFLVMINMTRKTRLYSVAVYEVIVAVSGLALSAAVFLQNGLLTSVASASLVLANMNLWARIPDTLFGRLR